MELAAPLFLFLWFKRFWTVMLPKGSAWMVRGAGGGVMTAESVSLIGSVSSSRPGSSFTSSAGLVLASAPSTTSAGRMQAFQVFIFKDFCESLKQHVGHRALEPLHQDILSVTLSTFFQDRQDHVVSDGGGEGDLCAFTVNKCVSNMAH